MSARSGLLFVKAVGEAPNQSASTIHKQFGSHTRLLLLHSCVDYLSPHTAKAYEIVRLIVQCVI